ncbi:ADP-ribosyltransferase [Desulfosporosinus hippei]|uniref:ADP-ribosyltransferase exoenzyme n=1 Tax=Desulfosporosinus hippei DSM 8344 TaxID=1121419 RepID=A0A1G7TCC4_9FIRM|nr:ADP-ribosyltransferase [Desulfosporosinus hippei]SDG32752.1 ADP-ribosyltransferase exoenzyme [Desulfosporosinus hippei DSM 8344]
MSIFIKIKEIWQSFFEEEPESLRNDHEFYDALQEILNYLKRLKNNSSYQVFECRDAIRQWSNHYYSTWEEQLTSEEVQNIKLYTSCSFKYNEHFRHCKYPRYEKKTRHIDSALEKAFTPEDVIAFRWIDLEGLQGLASSSTLYDGKKLLEKGFSSTTLFFNGNTEYSADVLFILKVPKDFNGACLKNISNIQTEDELLLKRNAIYTVERTIYSTTTHAILLCNVQ